MLRLLILLAGAVALTASTGCTSNSRGSGGCTSCGSSRSTCLDKAQRGYCDCGNDYNPLDPYCRCGDIRTPPPIISSIPVSTGMPLRGTMPLGMSLPNTPNIGTSISGPPITANPLPMGVPGTPLGGESIKESPKEK